MLITSENKMISIGSIYIKCFCSIAVRLKAKNENTSYPTRIIAIRVNHLRVIKSYSKVINL